MDESNNEGRQERKAGSGRQARGKGRKAEGRKEGTTEK